jgi:hypothetical protein
MMLTGALFHDTTTAELIDSPRLSKHSVMFEKLRLANLFSFCPRMTRIAALLLCVISEQQWNFRVS